MRLKTGGVSRIAKLIERDLAFRETGLSKPQQSGLADIGDRLSEVSIPHYLTVIQKSNMNEISKMLKTPQ